MDNDNSQPQPPYKVYCHYSRLETTLAAMLPFYPFYCSKPDTKSLYTVYNFRLVYLTAQILMSAHKLKGDIEPSDFDLSFYENGFRYYAFENDTTHDMQSQIMMYSFQNTPEKTLLRFCEKAKVLGISATATVPSVIGNFDID